MTTTPSTPPVIISGGGIAGMAMALTLHQIGVPCVVLEAVSRLLPLGVGINLQPNAVRELMDLGLGDAQPDVQMDSRCSCPDTSWLCAGHAPSAHAPTAACRV